LGSHRNLIDALLARDAATAIAEMDRHLDDSRMRMTARLSERALG
jgi:DNA-binding GntR family transcriptional regulator